jgi:ubiquinone/menaquinone biosynthesis C-methylase UbiE
LNNTPDSNALQFDRYSVRYLLDPWAPELVAAVQPQKGQQVLDVACGTGSVTLLASRCCGSSGRVVGLDLLPEMLSVASTKETPQGARIEWLEGDASSLPLPDDSFDVVCCQQGLQFFADRVKALSEMRRVLGRGGRVGIVVWQSIDRNPYYMAAANASARIISAEAGAQMQKPFSLADAMQLEGLLAEAGFRDIVVKQLVKNIDLPPATEFVPEHFRGNSQSVAFLKLEPGAQERLVCDVASEVADYATTDGMSPPFEVNLAVARK